MGLDFRRAVGMDDRGVQIDGAGILTAGPAKPVFRGVIVGRRIAGGLGQAGSAGQDERRKQHAGLP